MDTQVREANRKPPIPAPNRLLILWAVLRLPLLAIVLYLGREPLLEWIEQVFGVGTLTVRVISLLSTGFERGLLFVGCFAVLATSLLLVQRLRSRWLQFGLPIAIALVLFLALFTLLPTRKASVLAILLALLLAANTLPEDWVTRSVSSRRGTLLANLGFGLAIGLAELLLPKPFLLWLLARLHGQDAPVTGLRRRILNLLPAIVISALGVLLVNTPALVEWGWTLHRDAAVQRFARGDLNVLAFNPEQRVLYASGRGVDRLQAYNVDALDQPPRQSSTPTNSAQGFFYNPQEKELYFYAGNSQIVVLDANSLALKKTLPVPKISPGDAWLVWDRFTDDIIIASEADRKVGTPFVAVNRTTGKVTQTLDLDPSYLYISQDKPRLYMNFFRRTTDLILYDTQTHQISKRVPTDKQVDRMAFVPDRNEILVTSPVKSELIRYDADTLERKGSIKTLFGVRSVAVDTNRNLLLTGSLANNLLEVIDLKTEKRLAHYRLGPWLRDIALDAKAGVAYVSSNGALFKVNYTARL